MRPCGTSSGCVFVKPPEGTHPTVTPALRVLVIDDDPVFRRYAERVLAAAGFLCFFAADIRSAQACLRTEAFDVLVLDINLPDGSGIELLRSLPELGAALPVIMVTGQPTVGTAIDALRLEAMDYLTKPDVDLVASIERTTARFRRARERPTAPLDKGAWAAQLRAIADYLGVHGDLPPAPSPGVLPPASAGRSGPWASLSRREAEVVEGLLRGHAPADVAAQLGLGLSTVRNHIQSAYRRLGVRSQLELMAKLREP